LRQVIVAVHNQEMAQKIKTLLEQAGLSVAGICGSGAQVLHQAASCPDGGVIVSTLQLPDMPLQQLLRLIPETFDYLVLIKAGQQELLTGPGIYSLSVPVNGALLVQWARQLLEQRQIKAAAPTAGYPQQRPAQATASRRPLHGRNSEEQKLIEQAKYLLINRRKISEQEAHRYMQRKSMQSGMRLVDLAIHIIEQP